MPCSPLGVHFINGLFAFPENANGIIGSTAWTWAGSITLVRSILCDDNVSLTLFPVAHTPSISWDDIYRRPCTHAWTRYLNERGRNSALIDGQPSCVFATDGEGGWSRKKQQPPGRGKPLQDFTGPVSVSRRGWKVLWSNFKFPIHLVGSDWIRTVYRPGFTRWSGSPEFPPPFHS